MREADPLGLLGAHASLLLAVSGGPDSVALMLLAARWRERESHDIAVASVDHGLRDHSRAEAEQVGLWAGALGFPHHLLAWTGDKPTTRIQERARDARYALLAARAKQIGASAIVTAHHADDQAETILFRLTRGSGIAGLAGMATASSVHGVALLRPLLHLHKAELEDVCRRENHPFLLDPSNANEDFARVRLRKLRPLLAAQGLDTDALLRIGARAGRADAALIACAGHAHALALRESGENIAVFDAHALRDAPLEILQRVLTREIARLAPERALRLDRLEHAAQRLHEALERDAPLRITIADLTVEAAKARIVIKPAPQRRQKRSGA